MRAMSPKAGGGSAKKKMDDMKKPPAKVITPKDINTNSNSDDTSKPTIEMSTKQVESGNELKSVTKDDDDDWKYIDQVENVVFCFSEENGYELEVVWTHNDHEYFIQRVNSGIGRGTEVSESFLPLIKDAAAKATKMKAFMVRYNNELDRTWPYPKVSRIAEVVSNTRGVDVSLESVDSDYFEYIINLVPITTDKKRKSSDFVGNVDFSGIDLAKKYHVLDYIGGNAMELL